MLCRVLVLLPVLCAVAAMPALVSGQSAGRNLDGTWNSATATPLERPRDLRDKPFFTAEEAAAWEQQVAKNNESRRPRRRGAGRAPITPFIASSARVRSP